MSVEPSSHLDWLYSTTVCHTVVGLARESLVAAYFALKPGGFIGVEHKDAAIYGLPFRKSSQQTRIGVLGTYHKFPDRAYKPVNLAKWVIPSKYCFTLKLFLTNVDSMRRRCFPTSMESQIMLNGCSNGICSSNKAT